MKRRFVHVQPSDLKFQFQFNKLSTCWVELTNKIDHNVAFKVKTTHPKKYCVRPNVGLISPGSSCVVKVSMQAQKIAPAPVPKDKFLVQSTIVPVGLTADDVTSEMFRRDKGNDVEELKLRVLFVTTDPPSPIPEVSEEDFSPEAPENENPDESNHIMDLFDTATTSAAEFPEQFIKEPNLDKQEEDEIFEAAVSTFESDVQLPQENQKREMDCLISREDLPKVAQQLLIVSRNKSSGCGIKEQQLWMWHKDWDRVSKLVDERSFLMLENQELQYEVEMIRKHLYRRKGKGNGVMLVALLACFLGFVVGYVIK